MAATSPAIELVELSKMFGAVAAVDGISLSISDRSFTSLIGPSGSGKTTALAMIAGFEQPTRGSIRLYGREVGQVPPYERNIGMVFQSYALFPHLTVFENVAFPLRIRREPERAITDRVGQALAMVGLGSFGLRYPKQLSGGQQQRVALARAFVFGPRVLLMDEPLGALDKNLREQMQGEIKTLQRTLGVTVVYVTHDQGEALSMSDTVVVMSDGHIRQVGAPEEIYRRPRTAFVARFLGETNLLDISSIARRAGTITGRLTNGMETVLSDGADVAQIARVSLRPEDINIGGTADNSGKLAYVEDVVFLGDSIRCRLDCGGLRLWAKVPSSTTSVPPLQGERVMISWDPDSLIVLADESN